MEQARFTTVDQYIATFLKPTADLLQQLRKAIKEAAPNAEEVISYNMPAYNLLGKLVYFAANKEHIGFYPFPSAIEFFKAELKGYETSKGTVKFYFDNGIPKTLVKNMVKFRAKENLAKAELKASIKASRRKTAVKKKKV